jgi:hypothetical protein
MKYPANKLVMLRVFGMKGRDVRWGGKEGREFFEDGCGAVALDIVAVGRIC